MKPLARIVCVLALASAPVASAQEPVAPPDGLRQPDNFSHLVGQFTLSVSAMPTDVFIDEPILLTVRIHAKEPPPNNEFLPERKHLRILPDEMKRDFDIGGMPDRDSYDPKTRTWTFQYQLQPKNEKVSAIPALDLMFYNPQLPPDFRYQPSTSSAIPLTVKARPQVIVAPDAMYQLTTGDRVLRREESSSLLWLLIVAGLVLPPAASIAVYRNWRGRHPDRASRRRQSTAARQALRALRLLRDDTGGLGSAAVFTRYLQARLDLPPSEPTPLEVRLHLWKAGLSSQLTDRVGDFYEATGYRFAPLPTMLLANQREEVTRLILSVEEATL